MNGKQERDAQMDILAMGSRCTRCGVFADEKCQTPKGRETYPHKARIDRAVKQYIAARDAKTVAEAPKEQPTVTKYEVECQEDCNDGTMHEATYSHDTYGKKVYVAVCNGYEDTYTEDVVWPVEVPEETAEALGLDLRQVPEVQDAKTELVTIKLPDGSEQSRRIEVSDFTGVGEFLSEVVGTSYRSLNQEYAGRKDDGTRKWLLRDHRGDTHATIYKKRGIQE
jgi:hypothetical protein